MHNFYLFIYFWVNAQLLFGSKHYHRSYPFPDQPIRIMLKPKNIQEEKKKNPVVFFLPEPRIFWL